MTVVRVSRDGLSYLVKILREKKSVLTRAMLWRIPHATRPEEVHLKIGRYTRDGFDVEKPETATPKSELTLDDDEFRSLVDFISENYEPFRAGVRRYIAIDENFTAENVEHVRALFRNPNKKELLAFLLKHEVVPQELLHDIEYQKRIVAIKEFEEMLSQDRPEADWQTWFKSNSWVLGSEFVRILDERIIDPDNIADYLVEAYDGFLDIIEIKRPGGGLIFWAATLDHGNHIPSTALIKAISQSSTYVFEVEREINSQKFLERVGGVPAVKPRCVLVFGRSNDWSPEQKRAFRILNANYHNLSLMTYDHVLARAKRLLGIEVKEVEAASTLPDDDDIPF
jgi:hypothetical protein